MCVHSIGYVCTTDCYTYFWLKGKRVEYLRSKLKLGFYYFHFEAGICLPRVPDLLFCPEIESCTPTPNIFNWQPGSAVWRAWQCHTYFAGKEGSLRCWFTCKAWEMLYTRQPWCVEGNSLKGYDWFLGCSQRRQNRFSVSVQIFFETCVIISLAWTEIMERFSLYF